MSNPVTSYNPAETSNLLSGKDEVKGTKVYSPAGDDLGHIDDVMIDAASGKVVYGVLEFGGFLGRAGVRRFSGPRLGLSPDPVWQAAL
ncbi:PRC-barrel domain-containing protein [Ketogulonicigenium vulgare]|uniref:PRC-barrel domain-containing protein n=1 Tax=Ketogulonicigenium vulgare TaxID=92945 RepID=UPI0002D2EB96